MAILLLGKSKCSICGKVISDHATSYSFPAFISNPKSKYARYSDASFHRDCLQKDPVGMEAVALKKKFQEALPMKNHRCMIDGKPIGEKEEQIFIEYLTDETENFLNKHSYMRIRSSNLAKWFELGLFVKSLNDLKISEPHMGVYADRMLKKIAVTIE